MRHMPHTRQTVSFDVALVLEKDFLAGAFKELEIPGKFSIEFVGVGIIFRILKLLQYVSCFQVWGI